MKNTVTSPAAEETAALWAARLDGSVLTAEQRIALDAWLAAAPEHRPLLTQYCQFSADLEQHLPLLAGIRELSADVQPSLATAQPYPWSRWPLMASVALTAAAAVALVFWLGRPKNQFADFITPVAQRQALTLADGTRVELNANTSIFVENSSAARRVRLSNGEAFFVVSKDKARPFTVETPAGSVRVTGTIFNVFTEASSQLEVTVVEGSVQVRPGEAAGSQAQGPIVLGAGDRLTDQGGAVSLSALSGAEMQDTLAWRKGQIVCVGMPLSEALARYAHYHGRWITVSAAAGKVPVGGVYGLGDLDEFLAYVRQGLNLRVEQGADGLVRVSLPTEP